VRVCQVAALRISLPLNAPHCPAVPVVAWAPGKNSIVGTFAFCTSAAEHGASIWKILNVSRSLRGYVRCAESFKDHAGAGFL